MLFRVVVKRIESTECWTLDECQYETDDNKVEGWLKLTREKLEDNIGVSQ